MFDQKNIHPVCQKCGAWSDCKTPKMDGEGSETPETLFIGEAPGAEEDTEGRPFVGKSGRLLRELIDELHLTSYRITNAVRCRPPGNKLRGTEADFCKKFLYEEVLKYRPKLIVTLGAVPLKAMTGINGIMRVRGEVQEWYLKTSDYDPIILPTIHPASTLYRPENLEYLVQDFNLITLLLQENPSAIEEHHRLYNTEEDLIRLTQLCQKTDRLSIDTETTGLNVYEGAEVITVSLSWAPGEGAAVSLDSDSFDRELCLKYLRKIFTSPVSKYFHNARFDVEHIEVGLGIPIVNLYGDTMIAQFLTDETLKRGLKYLTGRYLKIYRYDKPLNDWFKEHFKEKKVGMKAVPKEVLYPYACKDADYTRRLSYVKEEELKSLEMTELYFKHMMPLVRSCIDLREAGIKVDLEKLNTLKDEYEKEINEIDTKLNEDLTVKQMVQDKGLNKFLLSSPVQVSDLLFNYLGLAQLDGTSTNKRVLFELAKTNSIAELVLEYRKKFKMYSAFILPMYTLMDRDGFARPEVIPDGTRSGRTSCRNPNLQQSPWDSRVRGIYKTRFEGGKLALIDYSQIELRVMAMFSGDPTMSKMYTELDEHGKAKDFHKETASIIYRVPIEKVEDWQRRFIKTVNFGVAYGRGAEAIAAQFDLTTEYCRKMIQEWWARFPLLKKWKDETHQFAKDNGFIRTPYGRRRLLPGVYSSDNKTLNGSLNSSINSPVQGTAADICCEAMIQLNDYRKKNNCKFKIVMIIHDSIMFDLPPEEMHLIEEVFVPTMKGIRHSWMRDIPHDVSVKVADNWGDMENMKMRMEGEGQEYRDLEFAGNGEEDGEV